MDVVEIARQAAEQLISELAAAERATDGWSNEPATNALVAAAMSRCLERLERTGCWGPDNRLPSGELWRVAASLLCTGDLQVHARTKPRGYAGDFELLLKICRHTVCDHPLGRAMDHFFQRRTAPQAVRNRTERTAAEIVRELQASDARPFRVVSIGSGPAEDVRQACVRMTAQQRLRMHVTLIDLDPAALAFARTQLAALLPDEAFPNERLHCARENLYRLPRLARASRLLDQADYLFCTGLFDYLSDDDAVQMLATCYRHLGERGRLDVWNFSPHHPSQSYMEWIGNWYLIYRDEASLAALADQTKIPKASRSITSEATGTDLCLTVRKPPQRATELP